MFYLLTAAFTPFTQLLGACCCSSSSFRTHSYRFPTIFRYIVVLIGLLSFVSVNIFIQRPLYIASERLSAKSTDRPLASSSGCRRCKLSLLLLLLLTCLAATINWFVSALLTIDIGIFLLFALVEWRCLLCGFRTTLRWLFAWYHYCWLLLWLLLIVAIVESGSVGIFC